MKSIMNKNHDTNASNSRKKIETILHEVLQKITPTKEEIEKIKNIANRIHEQLVHALRQEKIDAEVRLEGSVRKGTWLAKAADFDFFILTEYDPKKEKDEVFHKILKAIMKHLPYKFEIRYAEHPYLKTRINEYDVDIVPAFKTPPRHIISAVDRTPYHTEFVLSKITPKLANEIRLLKAFFKGINVYGAEVKVGGFSGYACELLIIHYKTFIKVLEELSSKKQFFIDMTSTWNKKQALKKFRHPFILIDPTDPNRNVTSALRIDTLSKAILMAKLFLEKPHIKYFFPTTPPTKPKKLEELLNTHQITLILLKKKKEIPPDVYWGQGLRITKKIRRILKRSFLGLISIDTLETPNEIVLVVETYTKTLPKVQKIQGPPVYAKTTHIKKFYEKHKNETISGPWIENDRLYMLIKTQQKTIKEIIQEYLDKIKIEPSFTSFTILTTNHEITQYAEKTNTKNILIQKIEKKDIQQKI